MGVEESIPLQRETRLLKQVWVLLRGGQDPFRENVNLCSDKVKCDRAHVLVGSWSTVMPQSQCVPALPWVLRGS